MRTPAAYIRGVRYPEAFHGHGIERGFFEGWYIKLVSADRRQRWAVIPGIFRGVGEDAERDEAFVQVLDGLTGRSWYHVFPVDAFRASDRRFEVEVAGNRFDSSGVTLELPQLRGRIDYTAPLDPFPVTWRAPGIMGWFGLVPKMECFHGIVSLGHPLAGELLVEGEPVSFDGGRGYIEKDWGSAFPAGYVWLASNHIDTDPDASLVASVATIPWMRRAFRGTIIALRHGDALHTWATWNRSTERRLEIDDSHVHWSVTGRAGTLELTAERVRGGLLHAPLRTAMHQRVEETLDARVHIRHTGADGRVLLEGTGECAGLEVFGDTERMLAL
ncbi:tocopherol cyclase family protein [Salinibacterium sp. ZJ70]|uniref:tocopherol cyclase family protein n=1 Tax=Salinibacterium sp. ZJ70 TaxID=2708084 RepID=UPI0014229850|nr:tocopherol cyclase family protein [Salinibacterium sp. ZJ70]